MLKTYCDTFEILSFKHPQAFSCFHIPLFEFIQSLNAQRSENEIAYLGRNFGKILTVFVTVLSAIHLFCSKKTLYVPVTYIRNIFWSHFNFIFLLRSGAVKK